MSDTYDAMATARSVFPLAKPGVAFRQYIRLLLAKKWLKENKK